MLLCVGYLKCYVCIPVHVFTNVLITPNNYDKVCMVEHPQEHMKTFRCADQHRLMKLKLVQWDEE